MAPNTALPRHIEPLSWCPTVKYPRDRWEKRTSIDITKNHTFSFVPDTVCSILSLISLTNRIHNVYLRLRISWKTCLVTNVVLIYFECCRQSLHFQKSSMKGTVHFTEAQMGCWNKTTNHMAESTLIFSMIWYIYIYIYRLTLQNNRFNLSGTIPNMVEPCKTIFEINKQTTTTIPRCPQSLNWRHPATWHWSPQLPDAASGGSCFTEGNPYVAMCCFCNKWNKICFKSVSYFFYSQFLFVQRINPDGLVKFLLFLVKLPLVSSLNVTKYLECLHNFTWAIFMAEKLP